MVEAVVSALKWPFIALVAAWCGHEDGVLVRYEIKGRPTQHKVNLFCEEPDVRIPIFRSEND